MAVVSDCLFWAMDHRGCSGRSAQAQAVFGYSSGEQTVALLHGQKICSAQSMSPALLQESGQNHE